MTQKIFGKADQEANTKRLQGLAYGAHQENCIVLGDQHFEFTNSFNEEKNPVILN